MTSNISLEVRRDCEKSGGRFFECSVKRHGGYVQVLTHDGDTGDYHRSQVYKIGCSPRLGDDVIAYWDDGDYAFAGKSNNH